MASILWTVVGVLLLLWLLGLVVVHIAGFFIHVLLIMAVIVVVFALLNRMRA